MRSHQTSRTSQISHFWTKYEFGISLKREIWEKPNKKDGCSRQDINDGVFVNEKEKKSSITKTVVREIFLLDHSLSLVVICCTTLCHSLTLVITRCTTRLSFYKLSFLYCFIELKSLPNFVCSFIFDRLTSKVADVSAVFLWSQ